MAIKLLDESEMNVTKGGQGKKGIKEQEREEKRLEVDSPVVCITKKSVVILSKDKIMSADRIIVCERRESGTTSNCAICQGITKEMFNRCKNKWTEY
jgi:hypothetical protein